jgi:hypothetical protein
VLTYFAALAAFRLHDVSEQLSRVTEALEESAAKQIVVQIGEDEGQRFLPLWVAPPSDS